MSLGELRAEETGGNGRTLVAGHMTSPAVQTCVVDFPSFRRFIPRLATAPARIVQRGAGFPRVWVDVEGE